MRTASEVVLLHSLRDYFTCTARSICGIPRVTLTGTVQDWERIRARVEVLATYELLWWVERLRPILDEFVATAKGRPNRAFWQAIYKPAERYFTQVVTGWIADLFPYQGEAAEARRNEVFEWKRVGWLLDARGDEARRRLTESPGPELGSFPCGLCSVPVEFRPVYRPSQPFDLLGGFVGVEQLPDGSLAPVISWALAEPGGTRPGRG